MSAAWFVVCIPPDRPDGPGSTFGPFPTRDLAQGDADATCAMNNNHVIVRGVGAESVRASATDAWIESYDYYLDHLAEIPTGCRHLFRRTLERAGL